MNNKLVVAILRMVAIVGQVALVKLYTHYLSPAELGQYFFWLTISYFLNALLFVPMDYFQQAEVFHLKRQGHSLGGLLQMNRRMMALVVLATVLVAGITSVIRIAVLPSILSAIALSVLLYFSTAVKNFLNNHDDQVLVVLMLVIEIPIRVATFMATVKTGFVGPLSPIFSTSTAYLLTATAVLYRVRFHVRTFPGNPKVVSAGVLTKFCAPISLGAIMNWLQLQGYRLVLVPLGYAEPVGLYATTAQIGTNGMNAAGTIYQQIYMPKIYQTHGKYLRKYLLGLASAIVVVLLVSITFRTQIVRLLTNGRFAAYSSLILYGILTEAGNFLVSALVVRLTIDHNTKVQINANVIAVVAVVALFVALFWGHALNVYTIGLPLVLAQVIVVSYLVIKAEMSEWKERRIQPQTNGLPL